MAFIYSVGRVEALLADERSYQAPTSGYVAFAPILPPEGLVFPAYEAVMTIAHPEIAIAKQSLLGSSPAGQIEAEQKLRSLGFSNGQIGSIIKNNDFKPKFVIKLPFRAKIRAILPKGMPFYAGSILFYYCEHDFIAGRVPISKESQVFIDRRVGAQIRPDQMESTPWTIAKIAGSKPDFFQPDSSLVDLRLPPEPHFALGEAFLARFPAPGLSSDRWEDYTPGFRIFNKASSDPTSKNAEQSPAPSIWPYTLAPRGAARVAMGLDKPAPKKAQAKSLLDQAKRHGLRFKLPLANPGDFWAGKETLSLTRSPIHLSGNQWEVFHLSTWPASNEMVNEYVEGVGRLAIRPVTGALHELVAPLAGHCRMQDMPAGTFIESNTIVGDIELASDLVARQVKYLAAEVDSKAHGELATDLIGAGFGPIYLLALTSAGHPLTRIPIVVDGAGLVVETDATPRSVVANERLLLMQPARQPVLACRILEKQAAKLPLVMKLEVRSANSAWRQVGTTCFRQNFSISAAPRAAAVFELTLPVAEPLLRHGELVPVGSHIQLRLSDPSTYRSALVIPSDCVTQVSQSTEVLMHVGLSQLRPQPVQLGAKFGDKVEVLRGLRSGIKVVRHLSELRAQEALIGAAMLGFWAQPGLSH